MPSAVSPNHRATSNGRDEYDDTVDDFLKDLPLDKDTSRNNVQQEPAKDIDEEVKVKKKRKPVPKLDESLLLSQKGVPQLRKITKSRLQFKGKGHEFSDVSRLLNTYQLWLDDLYPRAKFRDALDMVEKLGHTKRMQITRKEWLDSTKQHQREASPDRLEDLMMSGALPADGGERDDTAGTVEDGGAIFGESAELSTLVQTHLSETHEDDAPDEDELDALLAEDDTATVATKPQKRSGPFEEHDDDEDELDALPAEQSPIDLSTSTSSHKAPPQYNFADEEDAMTGMDDLW